MVLRSAFAWSLMVFGLATAVDAAPPTVVISIKSIEDVLEDVDFIGENVGTAGLKAKAEQFLNDVTGGAGLSGVDQEKPLGAYWTLPDGAPADLGNPVVFIPVSDAAAFKKLVSNFVPSLKERDGVWHMSIQGQDVYAKVVDDYLFVSNSTAAVKDVTDPDTIVNANYDVALDINISSIPRALKQTFLETAEREGRKGLESGPKPNSEAEALGQKYGFDGTFAIVKAVVNDGDKLTFGFKVDDDNPVAVVEIGLTGKSNSGLAKAFGAYAKTPSAFSGVASESAALRVAISFPTTAVTDQVNQLLDATRKAAEDSIKDDESLKTDEARSAAKDVLNRFFGVAQATNKVGALHTIFVMEGGENDTVRLVSGTKIGKGDDAGKLLDDILKLSKENPELAKLKTDVAKHAGARIHSFEGNWDDQAAFLFGDSPAHLAFRADSLWFSLGGGNLDALKTALDASGKPAARPGAPISIRVKPATFITLVVENNEKLVQKAEALAGEPSDVFNLEILPTEYDGIKLRIEFGVELATLFIN